MNKKKNIIIIFLFIFNVFLFFSATHSVFSANSLPGLDETGKEIGYNTGVKGSNIPSIVGIIIQSVLAFIGVIFMVIILMGAFDIQEAGGNEEALTKGKNKIKNGAIGLAIVFSAYIASYIFLGWFTSGVFDINKGI